jgi:hypothetical protein
MDNVNVRTNALRYNTANGASAEGGAFYAGFLAVGETGARVTRLQLRMPRSDGYSTLGLGSGCLARDCIILNESAGNAGNRYAITTSGATWVNCLIIFQTTGNNGVISFGSAGSTFRNCTLIKLGSFSGFHNNNYSSNSFVNVAQFGQTNGNPSNGSITKNACYTDANMGTTGWNLVPFDTTTGSGFENITAATADFRIKDTSILRNNGFNDPAVTADISGFARPNGLAHDIGAWEFGATAAVGSKNVRRGGPRLPNYLAM